MTAKARPSKRLSKRDRDTLAMRSPSTAPMAASDEAASELLDVERLRFIRDTAQLLFIRSRDPVCRTTERAPMSADDCWMAARVLWTSKPKGC